jgi:hypothetical protein
MCYFWLSLILCFFLLYCLGYYFDTLHHNNDGLVDALIGMLMCCHQPSAYDSLGIFSIQILYLGLSLYLGHHYALQ